MTDDAQRAAELHALPLVVVAEAKPRTDGAEGRLRGGHAPVVFGGRQPVHLAADEQLGGSEERLLDTQRVARVVRRDLVGQMRTDVGMIESLVIEQGGGE